MSDERLAIAGSGAIATGLAVVAAKLADVHLYARSDASAERATAAIAKQRDRLGDDAGPGAVTVTTDWDDARGRHVLRRGRRRGARRQGRRARAPRQRRRRRARSSRRRPRRSRSPSSPSPAAGRTASSGCTSSTRSRACSSIELAFPAQASETTIARATALCEALGKTAVVVPDSPGFVVNKLLFPYLFSAVDFMEQHGMRPEDVDECMKLGAGHPMGPLALIDFVGLDVVGGDRPRDRRDDARRRSQSLIAEGALGRKSGRGFYNYG